MTQSWGFGAQKCGFGPLKSEVCDLKLGFGTKKWRFGLLKLGASDLKFGGWAQKMEI